MHKFYIADFLPLIDNPWHTFFSRFNARAQPIENYYIIALLYIYSSITFFFIRFYNKCMSFVSIGFMPLII